MVSAVSEEDVHNVITEALIRHGIQVDGLPEKREEKKKNLKISDIASLALSFCNIKKIENLGGLDRITKLQLDNNVITRIENLEHLTNLTWLDLSFNEITEIRGLETLTKLTDLSLTHNQISELENLDTLVNLNVLSIANNRIGRGKPGGPSPEVGAVAAYLAQFKNLRLLNLQDNPIAKRDDYKSMMLASLRNLVYLDFRRIDPKDRATAEDQQPEILSNHLAREEQERHAAADAEQRREHEATMRAANLLGVETLMDDMLKDNTDYKKLDKVPYVVEKLGETKDQYLLLMESFKSDMLKEHEKKEKEHTDFREVMDMLVNERDTAARDMVLEFERLKKHTIRGLGENPEQVAVKLSVPLDRLDELRTELMDLESNTSDNLRELNETFFVNYMALAEHSKSLIANYFTNVRELESNLHASMQERAAEVLDHMASDKPEESKLVNLVAMPDDIRTMIQDKEAFMGAVTGCHEHNTSKIDDLESALANNETDRAKSLSDKYTEWVHKRNRDRVMEVWSMYERHRNQLRELLVLDEGS